MIRSGFLTIALNLVAVTAAHSFDLNDCIINGMKGVSSDVAARQVRFACEQKNTAFKQARMECLMTDFGEPLELDTLVEPENYIEIAEPGFYSKKYLNSSNEKAVTFVRLEVMPAQGGPGTACDVSKRRVHAYKVMLKPRGIIKLIFPSSQPSNCVSRLVVIGRAPSWSDVSFSLSVKPTDKDPFSGID